MLRQASKKSKDHLHADRDGLLTLTTPELLAEKRRLRASLSVVDAAYQRTQNSVGPITRFLNRVVPNPIDLVIFLLLRLLNFRKEEEMSRVRKLIATTFASATLSRTELACHLGGILSGCSAGDGSPRRSPPPTAFATTHLSSHRHTINSSVLDERLLPPMSTLSGALPQDTRWFAFARYYAEHLTSDEHSWMLKQALDNPPPLQSERATDLQSRELHHTQVLLNTVFITYCALMDRVSSGSSTSCPGLGILSRRGDMPDIPAPPGNHQHDSRNNRHRSKKGGGVSLDAAVAFFKQEVSSYAKEWAALGCTDLGPVFDLTQSAATATVDVRRSFDNGSDYCGNGGAGSVFSMSGRFIYDGDSDVSDSDDWDAPAAENVSTGQLDSNHPHMEVGIEQQLRFQMDTLLLCKRHKNDITLVYEDHPHHDGQEEPIERSASRFTKVQFSTRIDDTYAGEFSSCSDGDGDASIVNEEPPTTSSNFVKSVKIFQTRMREDGDLPPTSSLGNAGDADPTKEGAENPTAATPAPKAILAEKWDAGVAKHEGAAYGIPDEAISVLGVSQLINDAHAQHFASMSTADIVLQLLRFSHEFTSRIAERQAHFDYSKMYTRQLDEALAPNAFLVLYGLSVAILNVGVFTIEVVSRAARDESRFTTFEVYQCIFFLFANTTTFPSLLVDILARADQIARSPSSSEGDDSFFGRLIPIKLGGRNRKGRKLADRSERHSLLYRARQIAADRFLLLTLAIFSPPLVTHVLPGVVLYAWVFIPPLAIFVALESFVTSKLDSLDANLAGSERSSSSGGSVGGPPEMSSPRSQSVGPEKHFEVVTAEEAFLPALEALDAEESSAGILERAATKFDPTSVIFLTRSFLRVVFIFLLMATLSASFTYSAVYLYAGSSLVRPPAAAEDEPTGSVGALYSGTSTYHRSGSFGQTTYLGAVVVDFESRSIECTLETLFEKITTMLQTGLLSLL